ncbi:hypothetical protein DPV78_010834 [Talaromyces pinophilus]|nr:hypothetical protein DPV78_010834 [Talaromyces pinophilus]
MNSPTNTSFSPPDTAYKLQKRITKIEKKLESIFRGSLSQAHVQHHHESHINQLITHHKRKNQSRSKRQVKAAGPLSIKDANGIINQRKKAEMDKA